MSEHGFHVHGPHDHELEHAAHSSLDSFAGRLAIVTAGLATVGAIFSFMSGSTESESLHLANEASIRRSEADSHWARVLTTTGEQHLAALAVELVPDPRKAHFQAEASRLAAERDAAQLVAEKLDAAAIALDVESDDQLRLHHRWAQGTTVLQISIAMAAIALLTKRRWLQFGVYGLGALGAVLGAMAWLHI